MSERLQKLLAAAGHGSRREIEEWIRAGRLRVNGHAAELGERADPDALIELDGRRLRHLGTAAATREVLLYHKPLSEVTTRSDPEGRPTVFERLPAPQAGRWVVIGRLDVNTTGLLLFTTDGELANRWMHPSSQIEREYLARVRGQPGSAALMQLTAGISLDDGMARFIRIEPARAPTVDDDERAQAASSSHTWFRVVLCEGRNREVRRLWQAVGFEVSRLMRIRFASVELPRDLKPGQWRRLPASQAQSL
jgi:23S rRNA pseudouridine2605 synthase